MGVRQFQVTLGAGITKVIPSGEILVKWVIFQNNAAHAMMLGGATGSALTAPPTGNGLLLSPSGNANPIPAGPISQTALSKWNVLGTSGDLLNVIYDDGIL